MIWPYTTVSAATSILLNHEIRATDYHFLNDADEIEGEIEKFKAYLTTKHENFQIRDGHELDGG